MSRGDRLALLGFFAVLLALLGWLEPTATAIGAAVGAVPGVAVAGRTKRLSARMDARLGIVEEPPRGLRPRRVAVRAGLHVAVLGGIFVSLGLLPFVGDELFAGSAAGVTALAAVLTGSRLRR